MAIDILINGQSAVVDNLRDIAIRSSVRRSNFQQSDDDPELEIDVDTIVVKGESANIIRDWISSYGMGVGVPTSIKESESLSLDYYIDLTREYKESEIDVECKLIKRKGTDSFFQISNAISFEIMARQGVFFPTVSIPYQIVKDNRAEMAFSLGLALWVAGQAVVQSIKAVAESVALAVESVNILDPIGAGRALAQILINAAYLVANVLIAKKLADQLIEVIFPKVRYLNAVNVRSLLATYCKAKGYTFSSTLLDALPGLTILPVPMRKENENIFDHLENELTKSFTNGYPTALDTIPTVGDLFRALETAFNAKTKVRNGVVYFERWDFFSSKTNVQIPVTYSNQERALNVFTRNSEEAVKRYYISYLTDANDTHTRAAFAGTIQEVGFENANLPFPDLDLISGLDSRQIPFALGDRKGQIKIEELFLKVMGQDFKLDLKQLLGVDLDPFSSGTQNISGIQQVQTFAELIGVNIASIININKGVLQISEQYYTVTKLLYVDSQGRQPDNFLDKIGAPALYNNYHYINSIQKNARDIYEMRTKMSLSDFESAVFTEAIDIDGVTCEIVDMTYLPDTESVNIIYRKPANWAEGKVKSFVL